MRMNVKDFISRTSRFLRDVERKVMNPFYFGLLLTYQYCFNVSTHNSNDANLSYKITD